MDQNQLETAVQMRAQGESYRAIGAATELSHVAIYQQLQKDEISQLIKQAQTNLIKNSLKTAIQNQSDKISAGATITKAIKDKEKLSAGSVKLLELAHDSEKQLLQSVGIHNAHTQSITLNNILVDARSELSPAIEALLMQHITGVDSSVTDAEFTETDRCSPVDNSGDTGNDDK